MTEFFPFFKKSFIASIPILLRIFLLKTLQIMINNGLIDIFYWANMAAIEARDY